MKNVVLVPLVFFSFAPFLSAQQIPHPGDRIRLNAPCGTAGEYASTDSTAKCRVEGSFLRIGMDSVTLTVSGQPQSFGVQSIDRFEISQGERSHKLLGGVIGFVTGAGIAYLIVNSGGSTSLCDQDANQDAIGSTECVGVVFLGGALGWGIGYIIGSRIHTERWTRIPLQRLRVSVGSTRVGLALDIPF